MQLAHLAHEEALADLDHRGADDAHAAHADADGVEHVVVLDQRALGAVVGFVRGAVGRPVGRLDALHAAVADDDVERAQRVVERAELDARAVRRGRRHAGDRLAVVAADVRRPMPLASSHAFSSLMRVPPSARTSRRPAAPTPGARSPARARARG